MNEAGPPPSCHTSTASLKLKKKKRKAELRIGEGDVHSLEASFAQCFTFFSNIDKKSHC